MAFESSTATTRPTHYTYASPDLNLLLSGHLVTPLDASNTEGQVPEGAQFQLDQQGIYIEHPSLVSITTTPTSQTLCSLNTGQPILTLSTPLIPPPSSPSPSSSPSTSPSHPPPTPPPTIITLHPPLLTPTQVSHLQSTSSLYSSTFHILLDGPGFLPPRFDPHSLPPPSTPQVAPSSNSHSSAAHSSQSQILNSPTLQRALLSPLLSPQRRAHSTGSDTSVPPLSLGLSRARAPSLSAPSGGTRNGNGTSPSRPPQSGLESLLPASTTRPSLDSILSASISSAAKSTAEEIMALRRGHDAFVKRVKVEVQVLQTRVSNATNHAVAREGGGLVVKGFRSSSKSPGGETRRESLSREQNRERSVERGTSEERGRARAPSPTHLASSRSLPILPPRLDGSSLHPLSILQRPPLFLTRQPPFTLPLLSRSRSQTSLPSRALNFTIRHTPHFHYSKRGRSNELGVRSPSGSPCCESGGGKDSRGVGYGCSES
ncbi:hypothetical protein BCR35DRAFT_118727 [Leucosporidium creatinivorum]|uniref:Uncharacterized protein n=1 Tax=Leucosporidium creatinivorum TaxID=106004 RepID=A0A1Y2EZ53_9BASI|nr:hypothetical protein BCR35DRAFT_118727 [Leucosporidium creatinivorum]